MAIADAGKQVAEYTKIRSKASLMQFYILMPSNFGKLFCCLKETFGVF
ncbi:hypothetical protein AAULR_04826 [Lacticaseibacillus rhamnosus MTCC 5462]|nr:hypothetical protein AAULR_04826 [Lacticaseibacillus rhamnosus MTCC 5462]